MSQEPIYQQRGGFYFAWPVWWFAIFNAGASWPFSKMKVYSDYIEIRTLFFFVNRYEKADIFVRRWKLIPMLIDGIAIQKPGSSGSRIFTTFSAGNLLDELLLAGYARG